MSQPRDDKSSEVRTPANPTASSNPGAPMGTPSAPSRRMESVDEEAKGVVPGPIDKTIIPSPGSNVPGQVPSAAEPSSPPEKPHPTGEMLIVNPEKTRSMNINGMEFLAGQPIVNIDWRPGQKEGLLADQSIIKVTEDAEELRASLGIANRRAADARTHAGSMGIDLSHPLGLQPEQVAREREERRAKELKEKGDKS